MQGNRMVVLTKASLIKASFLSLILVLLSTMPLTSMAQYMTRAELLESIEIMKKQHASLKLNTLNDSNQRIRQPHEGKGNRSEKATIIRVLLNNKPLGAIVSDLDLSGFSKEVIKVASTQDLNRAHQYLSRLVDKNEFYVSEVSKSGDDLKVVLYSKEDMELLRVLNDSTLVNEAAITAVISSTPTVFRAQEPEGIKPYEPEKWTKESGYQEAVYQLEQSGEEYVVVSFVFRDPFDKYVSYLEQPYYQVIKEISKGRDQNKMIGFEITDSETNKHYATERINFQNLNYVLESPLVSNIVPR